MDHRAAFNCSGVNCTCDEMMFEVKMIANLANLTRNAPLFCRYVDTLWYGLSNVYSSSNFSDHLVYSEVAVSGYGFTDSILKRGHFLFNSLLHIQALRQLAELAEEWGCGDHSAMRKIEKEIVLALNGPILWNETSGMFRPSSDINTNLTDVWGSALAVELGVVSKERVGRIVDWFGENWESVVHKGQIRHLPQGSYFPETIFNDLFDTYQNGGYWGTPSGWVLPVIGRANRSLAEQLVRDAISDARENGLNEWMNHGYCSNCAGRPNSKMTGKGCKGVSGIGCQGYPISGRWLGGALNYGSSIGGVYRAAQLLLR